MPNSQENRRGHGMPAERVELIVGVGLVAAGIVAAGVAIFSAGVVVSTPALIAIAAITAALAIGIGLVVDIGFQWPAQVKDAINQRIDEMKEDGK